jgi:hypothetical protein
MHLKYSAHKITAARASEARPITSIGDIDKAARRLAARYGADLSGLNVDAMTPGELHRVEDELMRLGKARYALGLPPLRPSLTGDAFVSGVPVRYFTYPEFHTLMCVIVAIITHGHS